MIAPGGARAYGSRARQYAPFLDGVPIFVVSDDLTGARDELLEIRRKGLDAAVLLVLDDPRAEVSRRAAVDVYRQLPNYDVRRSFFDPIESGELDVQGRTLLDICVHDPNQMTQMRQLVRLAGALVVRSHEELRRIRACVGPVPCNVARWFPRRELPPVARVKGQTVILWAGGEPGNVAAIAAFAMDQRHAEVVIVARDAPNFPTRFTCLAMDDPRVSSVLARAGCVVDLSTDDPSWAVAFSCLGFPVAAASTSGAIEVIDGISLYDPWSFRSIAAAVAEAFGRGPGRVREDATAPANIVRALEASQLAAPSTKPLVSIIIPTYNRRTRVESAVRNLKEQHYENLEIIVVNDGGEDVSHLAELDPRVRVVNRQVNGGVAAAVNTGIAEATGKYVEWAADDDPVYPDQVLRYVTALERTGAVVAHANTMLCTAFSSPEGIQSAVYDADRFSRTVDLCETYAFHRITGFMVRREEIVQLGGLAADLFTHDLELIIRLAERFDFVHVPSIEAESWVHVDEEQLSMRSGLDHAVELEKMFERHPAADRPYVAVLRQRVLDRVRGKTIVPPGY